MNKKTITLLNTIALFEENLEKLWLHRKQCDQESNSCLEQESVYEKVIQCLWDLQKAENKRKNKNKR